MYSHSATKLAHYLLIAGGEVRKGTDNNVHVFDTKELSWINVPSNVVVCTAGHATVVVENKVCTIHYMLGMSGER